MFTTCGSDEKRKLLESLGVKFISSSRDADVLETDLKRFQSAENSQFDLVLNSLSGRFIELGMAIPEGWRAFCLKLASEAFFPSKQQRRCDRMLNIG